MSGSATDRRLFGKKTVRDIEVAGRRLLVRVDFNVPLARADGAVTVADDQRIRAALPTIEYLRENDAALVLVSHLGRPKGPDPALSIAPVSGRLAELLDADVTQAPAVIDDEVERLASALRPGELLALEHRHVDGDRVYLPGTKTDRSRRVVHLTGRGLEAYRAATRAISTPLVWHDCGEPIRWNTFTKRVWHPALELAGLEARAPYCMRHTFAVFSLRAGVPIADLAREMGHTSVARTYITYSAWVDELGQRAANLRDAWATRPNATERRR
jgi:integrase